MKSWFFPCSEHESVHSFWDGDDHLPGNIFFFCTPPLAPREHGTNSFLVSMGLKSESDVTADECLIDRCSPNTGGDPLGTDPR